MGMNEKMHLGEKEKKLVWKLGLIVLAAILLMLFSHWGSDDQTAQSVETPVRVNTGDMLSAVEEDLESSLNEIAGAGMVTVSIKWQGITEKEYAYNREETKRNSESASDSESSLRQEMVLLDGGSSPVVINETLPPIEGVLIIAEGAFDPIVRETLLNAAATFLDVGANRIQVVRKG